MSGRDADGFVPQDEESTGTGVRGGRTSVQPEANLARVVVLAGKQAGRKYVLDSETLIGRSHECAICVDDPQVSRRHSAIRPRRGGGFEIEDLGSRNGCMVNGSPITTHVLAFGDRIHVGETTILLFTHQDPLEDQVLQRQKMEVLGRLGAGVAHDFNNLMSAAVASMDYLEEVAGTTTLDDEEVAECLQDVRTAVSRAAELTKRLLGFSRRSKMTHEGVEVSTLCTDVVHLLRRTFDRSIRVHAEVEPDLVVKGHQGELHQLLMNLCINARDAMPHGGTLEITAVRRSLEQLADIPLSSNEGHVLISVVDTGIGMDEETRQRVFEPFFTTKSQEAGAGLGLASVYEVATSHGGTVTVESSPGVGTAFRVYLPGMVVESTRDRALTSTGRGHALSLLRAGIGGKIFVVDDQDLVRRSLGRILKKAGHEVHYATNGREAVDMYAQADPQPDVILLDLDMPEMDGAQALSILQRMNPEVRVIIVSGYCDDSRCKRLKDMGALAVIGKPYDAVELLHLVADTLAVSRAG